MCVFIYICLYVYVYVYISRYIYYIFTCISICNTHVHLYIYVCIRHDIRAGCAYAVGREEYEEDKATSCVCMWSFKERKKESPSARMHCAN